MTSHDRSADPTSTHDLSRWGRTRFHGGRWHALWFALPGGILLAAGLAAVAVATGAAGPEPFLGAVAIVALTVWPCAGLLWALVVDRSTLRGATPRAEESIESAWYERAAAGAFSDVLLLVGLGTAAIVFTRAEVPTLLALCGVILLAMGSFTVRYLLQQRRG